MSPNAQIAISKFCFSHYTLFKINDFPVIFLFYLKGNRLFTTSIILYFIFSLFLFGEIFSVLIIYIKTEYKYRLIKAKKLFYLPLFLTLRVLFVLAFKYRLPNVTCK